MITRRETLKKLGLLSLLPLVRFLPTEGRILEDSNILEPLEVSYYSMGFKFDIPREMEDQLIDNILKAKSELAREVFEGMYL